MCSMVSTAILIKFESKCGWSYDFLFPHNISLEYLNSLLMGFLTLSFTFLQFILHIDTLLFSKCRHNQITFLFHTLQSGWEHYKKQVKNLSIKNTNTRRLKNTVLNNQEITEEIKEEIKKYTETNDNENTTTQNLWDAAKAVLRGKFIAIQSYLKKQETPQINNLTLHLKQ